MGSCLYQQELNMTTSTYDDRLAQAASDIADQLIPLLGRAPSMHGAAADTLRSTLEGLNRCELPKDAIALGVAGLASDTDGNYGLQVTLVGLEFPPSDLLRKRRRDLRKKRDMHAMAMEFLNEAAVHLPDQLKAKPPEGSHDSYLICLGVVILALAALPPVRQAVDEARGDPTTYPLVLLVDTPDPDSYAAAAAFPIPCSVVADPPSFGDLMADLEGVGND
jgi:hypothetical protein